VKAGAAIVVVPLILAAIMLVSVSLAHGQSVWVLWHQLDPAPL
jgi:hypothetical protein